MRTESPRFNHKGVVAYIRTPTPQKKEGGGGNLKWESRQVVWFGYPTPGEFPNCSNFASIHNCLLVLKGIQHVGFEWFSSPKELSTGSQSRRPPKSTMSKMRKVANLSEYDTTDLNSSLISFKFLVAPRCSLSRRGIIDGTLSMYLKLNIIKYQSNEKFKKRLHFRHDF